MQQTGWRALLLVTACTGGPAVEGSGFVPWGEDDLGGPQLAGQGRRPYQSRVDRYREQVIRKEYKSQAK